MLLAELASSFNNVVCCTLSPGVYVACGEFLTVTDGSAWVYDINNIIA